MNAEKAGEEFEFSMCRLPVWDKPLREIFCTTPSTRHPYQWEGDDFVDETRNGSGYRLWLKTERCLRVASQLNVGELKKLRKKLQPYAHPSAAVQHKYDMVVVFLWGERKPVDEGLPGALWQLFALIGRVAFGVRLFIVIHDRSNDSSFKPLVLRIAERMESSAGVAVTSYPKVYVRRCIATPQNVVEILVNKE
jgi:hypothetical protein